MLNIGNIIGKFVKNSSQRELDSLKSIVKKGDCLLIKGSRGARMENVIQKFIQT